jgi:hypothetical protein
MGRARSSLVLCLKGIIAAWRYDSSNYIISLNASCHLYKPLSRAGRGFEGPIFTNSPAQCGVEPRDIHKPHFTPGYSERVKRSQRRLGTVSLDYLREGELSPVLPIELRRALRPRDPKPCAEQEAQSQRFQHSVLPVQVSLAGWKMQSTLVVRTRQMTPTFSSSSPPRKRGPRASGAVSVAPGCPLSRA